MKKFTWGIIILHICTKNHNHLMYGSWDTECNIQNFFSFWAYFLPFYFPLMILNIRILKKWKKLFYKYMCTINEDHMIYGLWNIRCNRQKILTFSAIFCPFSPLTSWKIKILTLEKAPGDIIILHICTTNDNHVMYGSWDMEGERLNFLSFWTVFCAFMPLSTQKIKIFKKRKRYIKILQTYMTVIQFMVPQIWSTMDIIFCHLGQFFPLLTP